MNVLFAHTHLATALGMARFARVSRRPRGWPGADTLRAPLQRAAYIHLGFLGAGSLWFTRGMPMHLRALHAALLVGQQAGAYWLLRRYREAGTKKPYVRGAEKFAGCITASGLPGAGVVGWAMDGVRSASDEAARRKTMLKWSGLGLLGLLGLSAALVYASRGGDTSFAQRVISWFCPARSWSACLSPKYWFSDALKKDFILRPLAVLCYAPLFACCNARMTGYYLTTGFASYGLWTAARYASKSST